MSFDLPISEKLRLVVSYSKFKLNQNRLRTEEKVIVDTTYGKVKGVKWYTLYGRKPYYSFEGIPFAEPPKGELRFKAPVEPKPWSGHKVCTHTRSKPVQYNIFLKQLQGSEDCLYLNVYTRNLNTLKPLPVLVWIFGGGFQMGETSRDISSPDHIMMESVVFVTVAYRLGPLGFLSLSDEDCDVPGNAGLKDQIMGLKWVKNNCHFFGGDPENITVFGESAGAVSTHYLMLTEQTKHLFHKAVVMSGSVMCPWANIHHLDMPYKLAKAAGYKGDNNDKDVLSYLKRVKPGVMLKICDNLLTKDDVQYKRLHFCFGPCVEPYKTENCVIDREPLEMLRDNWGNKIPLLIGGTSFEGLIAFTEIRKYPYLLNEFKEETMPPHDANLTAEKRKEYGRILKEEYFGDKQPSDKDILEYCDFVSYKSFWHGIHRTLLARRQYASAPTFLYRFDFDSKDFNVVRIIMCGRKVRGVCHSDDLLYLFYNLFTKKLKQRSAEYKTIRRWVGILVKFAECGDPNLPLTDTIDSPAAVTTSASDGINKQCNQQPHHFEKDTSVQGEKQLKIETNTSTDYDDGGGNENENFPAKNGHDIHGNGNYDEGIAACTANNDSNTNMLHNHHHHHHQVQRQYWPPITHWNDTTTTTTTTTTSTETAKPITTTTAKFKCLNISNELEVIDLPEAEKLQLWDSMYEDKSLLY